MEHKFCPYCMTPVEDGKPCGACGLTQGSYTPSPHHLPPGTVLKERYLVGRVLGEGGFGITYIGCDLQLELKVAIKEYFPTDKASRVAQASLDVASYTGAAGVNYDKGLKKFLQEARTIARMDKQPVIVNVRDFFEVNHTAYIVMEYVEGTTFKELVEQRGGRIPAGELLYLMEPLFFALKEMHSNGLIHRDISPENLMIEKGEVRLLDFGCARESADGGNTLTIALKHGYAPVEQYQSKGQGPWTDVYALSATIYYCLTGRKPPQAMDRLVEDELIPPRKLGVDLTQQQEKALLYGLGVPPRRRFQSMEEFHTALYEGFVSGASEEKDGKDKPAVTAIEEDAGGADSPDTAEKTVETPSDTEKEPFDPAAWLKQNKLLAGGIAAALALAILLAAVLPRLLGPSSVDGPDPSQSVAGTPEPENTDSPPQTSAPLDLTFSPEKDEEENGAVLLALLADDSVDTITVPDSVNASVDEPATLTKTLSIEAGGGVGFNKGLTVAEGGRVQVRGWLDSFALLRTMDGGTISVASDGGLGTHMLWLEHGGDLTYAPDSNVDIWDDESPDTVDDYGRSHYLELDEDELFANAVHVSSEEEFAQHFEGGTPIVIDSDITLTQSYWVTASVYIPEGVTVDAPCPDAGQAEGNCTLEMCADTRLVNYGTIKGRLGLHCQNDERGQSKPSYLINHGAVDAALWSELSTVINLGDITAQEILENTALANLGSLTVSGLLEMSGNWSCNAGTITVDKGGDLLFYGGTGWNSYGEIAVEGGGRLRNYSQINLNAGSLTVRDGGALHNYGSLQIGDWFGTLQAQPGAELENSGVVVDFGSLALDGIAFQGAGRILPRYDNDQTRYVSSESALRAALADDRCDLVIWDGYGPNRKINLNGGPLEVTKGLVLEGDRDNRVDFLTGGLTLSGKNAFFIGNNVDFHGSTLRIDGGTVLLDGDTQSLGEDITMENSGLLCLKGGAQMPDPGQLNLRSGGQFIIINGIELGQCAMTVDQDSALRVYGGLGLFDSSVTNGGIFECFFGNLYQQGSSLVNHGELRLTGWQERMALGDVTNHGQITVTGQRIEGTLVNEEDGTIILEWEDETLRVSGCLDNRGTIRGARGTYIETVDGGSFTGNPVVYGE